jgi:hypothetical protein
MAHDEKFYTKVYNLDPNSDEFNILKNRLSQKSPEMEVLEILRVQNKFSWLCYEREAKNLKSKLGYWSPEPALWHGTSSTDPQKIINEGFEVDYAERNGLCGPGIYFAYDSKYSMSYAHYGE